MSVASHYISKVLYRKVCGFIPGVFAGLKVLKFGGMRVMGEGCWELDAK